MLVSLAGVSNIIHVWIYRLESWFKSVYGWSDRRRYAASPASVRFFRKAGRDGALGDLWERSSTVGWLPKRKVNGDRCQFLCVWCMEF